MAGWLKRVDGSGLESLNIRPKVEEETKEPWPLPPVLGDGQSVDLFKLYLNVQEKGGFENASKNELWDSVARESGFDSCFSSALKLVYVKYLDLLDKALRRVVKGENSERGEKQSDSDYLRELFMELESDLKGFSSGISDKSKKDVEFNSVEMKKKEFDFECGGKFARLDALGGLEKLNRDIGKGKNATVVAKDNAEGNADDIDGLFMSNIGKDRMVEDGDMVSDSSGGKEEVLSRKRRRECYLGMLNWIHKVAKDPCDPDVGILPDRPKWKYYAADLIWKQVLFVREEMMLKSNPDSSDQQALFQKKQKMHPIMYDDQTGSERHRFSQRLQSAKDPLKKSRARIFSESHSPVTHSDEDFDEIESDPALDSDADFVGNCRRKKRIPVGPNIQADVPEWTGKACESDSKWLGTRLWPLERAEQSRNLIERERIGKGRQDSCGCLLPGSFECVRFHVSEKRKRLKLELGPAFYRWKFDNMGEDVALSWTKEEEKKFHNIVKSNPSSLGKFFWREMFKSFANKGRASLVSYYYNVFLLQRRGHQNRLTPNDINSDDEESESIYDGAKPPGSIFCSPKKHLNTG